MATWGKIARFKALEKFKNGSVNVLVATDVAARGLDIPDVALVLNATFPLTTGKCPWPVVVGRLSRGRRLCSSVWKDRESGEKWESGHVLYWRSS